jgi:hypothetical protein
MKEAGGSNYAYSLLLSQEAFKGFYVVDKI